MSLDFNFLFEEVATGEKQVYLDWLISGLQNTFIISFFAFFLSFLIGITLGVLASGNGVTKKITNFFLDAITSLPFIVIVFLSYFVMPQIFFPNLVKNINNDYLMFWTGLLSLSLCMGSRIAVNITNGLTEFKKSSSFQIKSAKSFGISKYHLLKDIVLPQVFFKIKPSLRNDVITIVKNSAVVGTIGYLEFSKQSQRIIDFTANPNEIFILLITIYILLGFISLWVLDFFFYIFFKK